MPDSGHGGAAMDAAHAEADRAMGDITAAADRATKARERLDHLIRDAREIRQQLEDDGRTAAGKVSGAADGMPAVPGAGVDGGRMGRLGRRRRSGQGTHRLVRDHVLGA